MTKIADILKARRALAKAVGRRVTKRKVPKQRFPAGARLRYQKMLTDMRKTLEDLLRNALFSALPDLLKQANFERGGIRKDSVIDDILRVFGNLQVQFAIAHPPAQVEEIITGVATELNEKQFVEHQRQMKAALGVELIVPELFVQSAMKGFIADNQALVKSLFDGQLDAFKTITSKGIRSGLRVESIQKELIAKLGITKNKAALLARDQTLKLFGELNEQRQVNVGIDEYEWDSSQDMRVRPAHAALHGTKHKWSNPPIVDPKSGRRAHPGGDYQCRCQAIPVIPEEWLVG